jgi:hypothetical protein
MVHFGVDLSERQIGRLLKQHRFAKLSVRPQHPRSDGSAITLRQQGFGNLPEGAEAFVGVHDAAREIEHQDAIVRRLEGGTKFRHSLLEFALRKQLLAAVAHDDEVDALTTSGADAAHPAQHGTQAPIGAAASAQVSASRKKFRGTLERVMDAQGQAGWQIVWSDAPEVKPGQRVSKKRVPPPLQALGFRLDELREARLAPIVSFKGRGSAAALVGDE